jgi:hypothetical protein
MYWVGCCSIYNCKWFVPSIIIHNKNIDCCILWCEILLLLLYYYFSNDYILLQKCNERGFNIKLNGTKLTTVASYIRKKLFSHVQNSWKIGQHFKERFLF